MNEGQIVPLGKPLLDTLERMSCGAVLLDEVGRVLLSNPTAIRMLHEEVGCSPNQIENSDWARNAIKKLLRRSNARFSLNSDAWVTIRREAGRDLVLHAVPIGEAPDVQARTVLIMIDLNKSPQPKSSVLQQMFGLTPAEERLAVQITRGDTPADIARETGVSIATVRSQLAAVFAKTQTGRQAELVALLARVAILP
jgi:DNA-binding CsgD family transcriptional regulator